MKKLFIICTLICQTAAVFAQSPNITSGIKALEAKQYDEALEYFNKAIIDEPTASLGYYFRACIYYEKSDHLRAMSDVNTVITIGNESEKVEKASGFYLRALIYLQLNDSAKAMADYGSAIKTYDSDPDFYAGRAQLYYEKKQYEKSIADYQSVLGLDGSAELAYAGLARNSLALNKYDEAIVYSLFAFDVNPQNDVNRELFLSCAEKNTAFAISRMDILTKEVPENDMWWFYKGFFEQNNAEYRNAIETYTKLLTITQKPNPMVLSHRAFCYYKSALYEIAIAEYDKFLTDEWMDAYDFGFRADAKRLIGNFKGAVKDFSQAITLEPNEAWFYYRRGWVYDEFLHNSKVGMNDYNKAIEINPYYAYTYLHRGKLYKNVLKDTQKAKADFETILKLDTELNEEGNCRHYALLELGRETEAIEWMNKILEKYPNEGNYYDAACMYSAMNKTQDAQKYITLAFENGYKDITHISKDNDLDNVRQNPQFKSVLAKWTKIIETENKREIKKYSNNGTKL